MLDALRRRARVLKRETYTLYLVARHPATPWYAKALAAGVAAYAFSPIDLIPDFVPVLGYLDDLLIVPLGVVLTLRLVPAPVLEECRARAEYEFENGKPVSRTAAVVIVSVWVLLAGLLVAWGIRIART